MIGPRAIFRRWFGGKTPGYRMRRAVAQRRAADREWKRRRAMRWLAWGLAGGTAVALGAVLWRAENLEIVRAIRRSARLPRGHPNEPLAPDQHPLTPKPR